MVPALNLHIGYDCPLHCRYCSQRDEEALSAKKFTGEEMIERVKAFMDYTNSKTVKVNISGGEPLLQYKDIQRLLMALPNNQYLMSTSGYLLDNEKARWLAQFNVVYILSVDGDKAVTRYLRPLENGNGNYFDGLKKNIPGILYYAPQTRAKLIVTKRLIDRVLPTYYEMERLGFRKIFITPNVYENTVDTVNRPDLSTGVWGEEEWNLYSQIIDHIVDEYIESAKCGYKRCLITNVQNAALHMIYPQLTLNYDHMICEVLGYKVGTSPEGGQFKGNFDAVSSCIRDKGTIKTQQELVEIAQRDFDNLPKQCPHDPTCPYLHSCVYKSCLSENLRESSNIWIPTKYECRTQRIFHDGAMKILEAFSTFKNDVTEDFFLELARIKEVNDGAHR